MKEYKNARYQKIYNDYSSYTTEKLREYLENASKYQAEVIDIIEDILVERKEIEENADGKSESYITTMANAEKQRHGCITAYLILMIVANSILALVYFIANQFISHNAGIDESTTIILGVFCVLNVFFAFQIVNWKKSGFYGFIVVSVIGFFLNLALGFGIGQSVLGFIGIGVLYGILQITKDGVSAWDNLK